MDPEKQPLLSPVDHSVRRRKYRTLTTQEVLDSRHDPGWRRARFFLVIMFWSIITMFLSIITCILIKTPKCNSIDTDLSRVPSVPPVHLSFAPLVFSGRNVEDHFA